MRETAVTTSDELTEIEDEETEATTTTRSSRRARRAALVLLALASMFATLTLTSGTASAATCRESSYIPSLSPMALTGPGGTTIHLQAGTYNYQRTVHVWINYQYYGQYYIPLTVNSDVSVYLKGSLRTEIWMGQVRQVYKYTPVVRVCGAWAYNALP